MNRDTTLVHLFDADMDYVTGKDPVTTDKNKVGKYIGSGTGKTTGKVEGSIEWDLYEHIDDNVCLTNFAGRIETAKGAIISFDARGHGKVISPDTNPDGWIMVYGVKFTTDNKDFAWLNSVLGVWEGEFDMKTYKHHYRVYANKQSFDAKG